MKSLLLILLLCSALYAQEQRIDNAALSQTIQNASFDFANFKLYDNENEWKGKTISVSGVYYPNRIYSRTKQTLVHVIGTGAFGPINIAAYLDGPMPTVATYGQETPVLTPGLEVRIVGTIKRSEPFISWEGYQMMLPSVDCIAIFRKDDSNMQYPLWVSRAFKR
jgi:hypothetical protein